MHGEIPSYALSLSDTERDEIPLHLRRGIVQPSLRLESQRIGKYLGIRVECQDRYADLRSYWQVLSVVCVVCEIEALGWDSARQLRRIGQCQT